MHEVRCRDVALLVVFLSGLFLGANYRLFLVPLNEHGDFAANSFLVEEAKRGRLWHGNYSRVGIYHPGPGLLWVHAAGEVVFHDGLGVVPAPFNGQLVGCFLFLAATIGLSLGLAALIWGRVSPIPVLLPLWLGYLAWAEIFEHNWLPNLYCPLYLALQLSAAAVALGHHKALPWLAATGGLLIHGHVSFVLFVPVLTAFAIAGMVWTYRGRVRDVWSRGRIAWVACVAVWAALAAPILIHTWREYPGLVWRYVGYQRAVSPNRLGRTAEAVDYVWRVQTHAEAVGEFVTVLVVAAVVWLAFFGHRLGTAAQRLVVAERSWRRVVGAVLGTAGISAACVLYYAARGVDSYTEFYIISFSRTVLLVVGLPIAYWLDAAGLGRRAVSWYGFTASAAASVALAAAGAFTWAGPLDTGGVAVADRIAADPRWATRRPIIMLDVERWPEAAGMVIRLVRQGRVPCVQASGGLGMIFPREFHPDLAALTGGDPWLIDVTGPGAADRPGRQRLGGWTGPDGRETVVWEITPVVRFGAPVDYVSVVRSLEFVSTSAAAVRRAVTGPDVLTLPVRVEFDAAPPAGPVEMTFVLNVMLGRISADTTGQLDVSVNDRPAGRVTYPQGGISVHRLPVPIPAADLAKPTLLTFRLVPPEAERDALLPSGDHYHAVRLIGLKFDTPQPGGSAK